MTRGAPALVILLYRTGSRGQRFFGLHFGSLPRTYISPIQNLTTSSPSFNPIFVLPVCEVPATVQSLRESKPISHTPGRRTGTGSAAISSPNRAPTVRKPVVGFQRISLLGILHVTGRVPPYYLSATTTSLEQIRKEADKPVVVFPECTTSNGRGMLRFANIFKGVGLPVKGYKIFLMCVRSVHSETRT